MFSPTENVLCWRKLQAEFFAARPFRLHPPGCLLVVRNILIYAFRVSAFCLPSACEIRVSGAQKISTVARVKACYVACSKHVFSHRKCLILKEAAGWVFRSPSVSATSSWVLFGRFLFQQFSFSTFSRQAIGLIEYLIDIPRIEMTLMTRTNREKAQVVASRKKQYTVVSVSDFTLRGNCREEKEPCSGFEPGNTALKSERSTARL